MGFVIVELGFVNKFEVGLVSFDFEFSSGFFDASPVLCVKVEEFCPKRPLPEGFVPNNPPVGVVEVFVASEGFWFSSSFFFSNSEDPPDGFANKDDPTVGGVGPEGAFYPLPKGDVPEVDPKTPEEEGLGFSSAPLAVGVELEAPGAPNRLPAVLVPPNKLEEAPVGLVDFPNAKRLEVGFAGFSLIFNLS